MLHRHDRRKYLCYYCADKMTAHCIRQFFDNVPRHMDDTLLRLQLTLKITCHNIAFLYFQIELQHLDSPELEKIPESSIIVFLISLLQLLCLDSFLVEAKPQFSFSLLHTLSLFLSSSRLVVVLRLVDS